MPLRLRLLFSDDAGSGGGPTESDPPEPDNGDTAAPTGARRPTLRTNGWRRAAGA